MTLISVEKAVLEDLVNHKLRSVIEDMDLILKTWKSPNADQFLEDARNGTLRNAEDDAVVLRNLLDEQERLTDLKATWK
jgi:hypothetical protein